MSESVVSTRLSVAPQPAQQVAQPPDPVAHPEADREAAHREHRELGHGRAEREGAGDDRGEGELEGDEAGRVVHQALAAQDRRQARAAPQALRHRADRHGVGRAR